MRQHVSRYVHNCGLKVVLSGALALGISLTMMACAGPLQEEADAESQDSQLSTYQMCRVGLDVRTGLIVFNGLSLCLDNPPPPPAAMGPFLPGKSPDCFVTVPPRKSMGSARFCANLARKTDDICRTLVTCTSVAPSDCDELAHRAQSAAQCSWGRTTMSTLCSDAKELAGFAAEARRVLDVCLEKSSPQFGCISRSSVAEKAAFTKSVNLFSSCLKKIRGQQRC